MSHRLSPTRALTLAVTWLAATSAHHGGDYLVQSDSDAQRKQQHTPQGRRALARHVVTYGATQAATKVAVLRAAGLSTPWWAVAAGQAVECALHAAIDDGRLLRRFAAATGKLGFHDLAGHGINGRALMDQAAHHAIQIPAGAITTAALVRKEN